MIYIYKHRNNINGKVYIGQTNNIEKRWQPSKYKKSSLFYRAIQKYGWNNFTHEILSEIEDQNEADNQEIALIEYFDSTNPDKGYNILPGGGINTRGMKHSEETKNKISNAHLGKKHDKQWVLNNKESHYRNNSYKSNSGSFKKGHINSDEIKNKINIKRYKRVIQYDLNMNFIKEWNSLKDIENELKISSGDISKVCNNTNNRKSAGGFIWRFSNDQRRNV